MDSTITALLNLMVMAQKIQALTANVQELNKQNEDLKRRVRSKGTIRHSHIVIAMTMTTKPIVQEIAKEKLLSTSHSRLMATFR